MHNIEYPEQRGWESWASTTNSSGLTNMEYVTQTDYDNYRITTMPIMTDLQQTNQSDLYSNYYKLAHLGLGGLVPHPEKELLESIRKRAEVYERMLWAEAGVA